jgi:hypothetical protein
MESKWEEETAESREDSGKRYEDESSDVYVCARVHVVAARRARATPPKGPKAAFRVRGVPELG